MHDSRDNEDMPTSKAGSIVNNLAYIKEALGGDACPVRIAELRGFWKHGGRHVLALRQYNWLTSDASRRGGDGDPSRL